MNPGKITGDNRERMLSYLCVWKDEGYNREEIVKKIQKNFGVTYEVSTLKYLLKEAKHPDFLKRMHEEERYMQKCREEYQAYEEEDNNNAAEAERLFSMVRREIDI